MLISTEKAAEILSVSRRRIQAMLETQTYKERFQAVRVGRSWVLDKKAVEGAADEARPAGRPKSH